jgi:hypothetical protein
MISYSSLLSQNTAVERVSTCEADSRGGVGDWPVVRGQATARFARTIHWWQLSGTDTATSQSGDPVSTISGSKSRMIDSEDWSLCTGRDSGPGRAVTGQQ